MFKSPELPIQGSSILWHNDALTMVVVDIPRSISVAQGSRSHPCSDQIQSCPALALPYDVHNEPKTSEGRASAQAQLVSAGVHVGIAEGALKASRLAFDRPYCLRRDFTQHCDSQRGKKRWREAGNEDGRPSEAGLNTANIVTSDTVDKLDVQHDPGVTIQAQTKAALYVNNHGEASATLRISNHSRGSDVTNYRIPPGSAMSLSNCVDSDQFRQDVRNQASLTGDRYKFDMIILDPPWPNRSVKRTHRTPGSTYRIANTVGGVESLLHGMDLDMLLESDGYAGVWVTNKQSLRELVLGEGGLFDALGVKLVEEWIWLKVTTTGEPVTPLQGTWRRPYEVFLVGRRQAGAPEVTYRTILAVPDLHSRKPCLKELIDQVLLRREGRQARILEIFARHLVSGWWSWGDECIKFNWEGYWRGAGDGGNVQ